MRIPANEGGVEDTGICEMFLFWDVSSFPSSFDDPFGYIIIFHQHQSWTCWNSTCSTCSVQGGFPPTPLEQNKIKSPKDSLTRPDAISSAFYEVSIFWWICFRVFIEWLNCKRMGVLQCYWTIYVENWDQLWSHMFSVCLLKHRFLREYVQSCFGQGPVLQNTFSLKWSTPRKINMEHNNGGLEDHFPFYMGDL